MSFRRALFEPLRAALVAVTGRGYDRAPWLNNLHHKLAFRLHRALPTFGITGIQQIPVPGLPGRSLFVCAEDGGVAHQLLMYRQYEPYESKLARERLTPGITVYNIGANLGYYALLASECVGNSGRVLAFEPEPNNLTLLQRTISENNVSNVTIYPLAVSATSGTATLSISGANSGDHQLVPVEGRNQIPVRAVSVDDFIVQSSRIPDAIIMDVQGSELDVLRGAHHLLSSNQPLLLFTEFWPAGLNARHPNGAREMLHLLESTGFQLFSMDEQRKEQTPVNADWLITTITGNAETNLLAARG